MPKKISIEEKRESMITLRLTAEEKEKLILISKALNLSYTDLFVYTLEFIDSLLKNVSNAENKQKIKS